MVKNEDTAKRSWEAITGDHSKAKFYQGKARNEYLDTVVSQSPLRDGYKLNNWDPSHNPWETVSQSQ